MNEISKQTARRYVLGRQGLWPGRRWQGQVGVEQALRAAEAIQVDTISVVARNHDLALWSRVASYHEDWLDELLYKERQFFEFGHILFVYPLHEWPYWKAVMSRLNDWGDRIEGQLPEVIGYVRDRIRQDGPLASRDFKGRIFVPGGFRVIKDVNRALQYLWMTGELLIHSRRGFDRVYELTERLTQVPPHSVSLAQAELFFVAKALRDLGLGSTSEISRRVTNLLLKRPTPVQVKGWLDRLVADGVAATVMMEGRKETLYYPATDMALIEQLGWGQTPAEWQPLGSTTLDEVNLLAPLDNVIWDRNRTKALFDFDYVWEVYKPASIRRWGYYTLPVLYGDRLVARLDPKLDRKTGQLKLVGFWLDEPGLSDDPAFGRALAAGLRHFARFHQARLEPGELTNWPMAQYLQT